MNRPALSTRRILVADNDPSTLLAIEELALGWGHEVVLAREGFAAWAVLSGTEVPWLALVDGSLPGMDGGELCRRVRGGEARMAPYLMVFVRRPALLDPVAQGPDEYLTRPVDPSLLRERVRAAWRITTLHARLSEHKGQLETERPAGEEGPRLRDALRLCVETLGEAMAFPGLPGRLRPALAECRTLALTELRIGPGTGGA
jgi:CheY-like chemotaxis protein